MRKCPECDVEHDRKQAYCLDCHAQYMRWWRFGRPLTEDQRKKDNCRSYANVYKRRGKLVQEPCRICGDDNSQMHHPDYDKPLDVEWLCRVCHLEIHRREPD